MDLTTLEQDLSTRSLKPVYLLHGQPPFRLDRLVARFIDLVDEGLRDFNLQMLQGAETPPGVVLEQAQTMPFMNPPRLIVVRGADSYEADDLAVFDRYLHNPNETTCLLLVAERVDFRLKFFKGLRDQGMEVTLATPSGQALIAWVIESMNDRGLKMNSEAAEALINQIGTDLSDLDGEMEKLFLYTWGRKSVTTDEVRTVARFGPTADIFALGDALGKQQPGQALTALNDVLARSHPLPTLVMIARHFRLLLKAKLVMAQGGREMDAAQALGIKSTYVARKYVSQAVRLDLAAITKALSRVLETNLALMSSQGPDRLLMERLVLELTSLRPGRLSGLGLKDEAR